MLKESYMKKILILALILGISSVSSVFADGSIGDIPMPAASTATPQQNYFAAVRRGDVTAVRGFLDSGAVNINAKEPNTGMNSLMIATDKVDLAMVIALISYKPTATDKDAEGRTVAQIASAKGNPQISAALANAGY